MVDVLIDAGELREMQHIVANQAHEIEKLRKVAEVALFCVQHGQVTNNGGKLLDALAAAGYAGQAEGDGD